MTSTLSEDDATGALEDGCGIAGDDPLRGRVRTLPVERDLLGVEEDVVVVDPGTD